VKNITVIAISFLLISVLHSTPLVSETLSPREILYVPWGEDPLADVRYQTDPDCRYGPQSFRVDVGSGSISILDPLNQAIRFYHSGSLQRTVHSPSDSRDFVLQPDGGYTCLANNQLLRFKDGNLVARMTRETALPLIKRIYLEDEQLTIMNHDGTVSRVSRQQRIAELEMLVGAELPRTTSESKDD
jgi:hypothetical protein